MTNNSEKIYFQVWAKITEKILSKLTDKIKTIEEKIDSLKNVRELPEFQEIISELKTLSQDVSNLKILNEKEKEDLTAQISHIQKTLSEFSEKLNQNEKNAADVREFLNNFLKEISEELEKIKEKISKYEKETKLFREGILKSPGIIGPSASGIEILLNNSKRGVYSKLNFIEGNNITFDFSENKQEGKANLTIHSTGGGSGGGVTTFLQLTDTPSSYTAHGLKLVQVNDSENALQFVPVSSLLAAGNGISLSGTTNVTITNTGILSLNAGEGISITEGQNPTITNTGVLSLNSATGALTLQGTANRINVSISGTTITLSTPQDIHTGASPVFSSLTLKRATTGNLLIIRNVGDTADVFVVNNSGNLVASGTGTFNTSPLTVGNLILSHSGLTAPRTFTFPDVSDTLVSLNATQTLTNKTLGEGSTWQGNVISIQYGGTGLSSIGSANQILGVNAGGTGLEYKNISSLLTAGTGISITGTTNVTITNTGILSLTAGPGISISSGQNPTISNTGVLSLNSATGSLTLQGTANQINVNTSGSTITLSLPQNIHTGATPTFAGLTLSSLTPGSILFAGTGGTISQNNSRLFWDNANSRLGIGTSTPAGVLHVFTGTVNALVVDNSGNVGIGTVTPGARLDVAGAVKQTGTLIATLDSPFLNLAISQFRDVFAFKTPTNFEYWNGTAWVPFTPVNPSGMTSWGVNPTRIPSAYKSKFRFVIDTQSEVGLRASFLVVRATDCCTGTGTYTIQVEGSTDQVNWTVCLPATNIGSGGSPTHPVIIPFSGANQRYARITFERISGTGTIDLSIFELHLFTNWFRADANLPIKWDSVGNVGIGTASPSRKLHIVDNVSTNVESLLIQNNGARASLRLQGKSSLDGGNASANVQFYDQDTTNNAHLVFESRATNAPLAVWINGQRRLGIYGGSTSGISVGSYSGTVPPNDGMIIPGNVGIGKTTPNAKLDVAGNMLLSGDIAQQRLGIGISGAGDIGIQLLNYGRKHAGIRFTGNQLIVEDASGGNVPSTWYSGSTLDFIVRNGNVGIGTTAPTARLHIQGTTGYNQLRLATSYTPTSSADPNGNVGDIAWDNNFIYVKTSVGWKRAALSTF